MGNYDTGHISEIKNKLINHSDVFRIQTGGRLIKNQYLGISPQGTGDINALTFTARDIIAKIP